MDSFRKLRGISLTLVLACAPLAAITVDTQSVTITYKVGTSGPNTGTVNISNATHVTARISKNIQGDGSLSTLSVGDAPGVFTKSYSDTAVYIGTDPNILHPLSQRGPASYMGAMLLISADGCNECISVALTLNITNGGSVNITYNGSPVPSSGIALFTGVGGFTTAILTLTSTQPSAFTVTSNQTWLTVNPGSGNLVGSQTVQINANSAGLPAGANTATVTVSAGGISTAIPVTLNVGTGGGISLYPNPLNFQYSTSGGFTSGQTQYVTISGMSATATVSATASSNPVWLLVGGNTSATFPAGTTQIPISVNPAVLNLTVGSTYQGSVQIITSENTSATLQVTLSITSTGGTSGSLSFSVAAPGSPAPAPQQITISGSGTFSAFPSVNNCGQGWIQVSPSGGTLTSVPTALTVQVFPGNIGYGTCTGSISISSTGILQNGTNFQSVSVTMTIGSGTVVGGLVAAPAALTFNLPPGASQSQQLIINGNGTSFTAQAIGTNLTVFPTTGTTPAILTVSASSSSSSGTITLTSSLGTQNVNVTVNVPTGNVLYSTSNPASIAYNYQGSQLPIQNISINASGDNTGNSLGFSVVSAPSYVSYTVTSTTTPSAIGIAINTNQLMGGLNTGNIVLSATTSSNQMTIPVTVLAPGSQGLSVTPNPLNMSAQQFDGPVSQNLSVSGLSGSAFNATALSTGNWLSVSPNSGTSPATLTVTASPSTLAASSTPYQGTVTISASGSSVAVPVNLTVSTTGASSPVLTVTPASLSFSYRMGDPAPATQAINLTTTNGSVNFTATPSVGWISLSQTSGTTPSTLNVTLNTAMLTQGSQTGTVTITATGATGSPQTVTITANVTSPPMLTLNAGTTAFTYRTGDPAPAPQTVQVGSSGSTLPFILVASSAPWLTVDPTSGITPATITLTVDPTQVQVGNYSATVTFSSTGAADQMLTVLLNVTAPLPTVSEVRNGASNLPGPVSPGEIIVITGTSLGSDPLTNYMLEDDVYATKLANTRVLVGGYAAPMVYASSSQVAAIVPYELAGKTSTFVQVEYLGQRSNAETVQMANTAPGVFTPNSAVMVPSPVILNQDGSTNSPDNTESAGRLITVLCTGEGQTIPAGINGKLADGSVLPAPVLPVTASINGMDATVQSYGAAPGQVAGIMQVQILVPAGATSGDLVLHIGGNDSQPGVTVFIR
jgi:uncharacterized protein (TIGR03437 family)